MQFASGIPLLLAVNYFPNWPLISGLKMQIVQKSFFFMLYVVFSKKVIKKIFSPENFFFQRNSHICRKKYFQMKLNSNVAFVFYLLYWERKLQKKVDYILINRCSGQIRYKLTSVDVNWPCRLGQFAQPRSIFPELTRKTVN